MSLRSIVSILLIGGALSLAAPPAQAAVPTRAQLASAVYAMEYEQVGGAHYGYYLRKYPPQYLLTRQIDWSTDGCSVPRALLGFPKLGWVLNYYSGTFHESCVRHDFGYRNYGSGNSIGLRLDPTEARRKTIDNRFHANMDIQCRSRFAGIWRVPQLEACYAAGKVYYEAVRFRGHQAFFG